VLTKKKLATELCGLITGFSFLFHWSTCLFLCQYHAVLRYHDTSNIAFVVQDCFGYLVSFMLPYEFWIEFSISVKNDIGILMRIACNM
jgi:hypothetical protein